MTGLGADGAPRLVRKAVLRHDDLRQTDLLLLPERVVKLNPTAAAILRLCDGQRSIQQVIDQLTSEFPDARKLGAEVRVFLGDAAQRGWIE
jgi:pyrroloquinoline quinone biosynthesis protein D